MGHYIENTGNDTLRFLEMFRSDHYADISLDQWLALTPPELVRDHLPIDKQTIDALSKRKRIVVARRGPPQSPRSPTLPGVGGE
jgi:oxalate decarboxylase